MKLPNMLIDIVGEVEKIKLQDKFTINPLISESKDSNNNINLNLFYEIDEASFLHISMPKDNFYSDFNNITKKSLRNLTILFIFSFISMNTIIIVLASQKINVLDISNRKHKLQSYKDTLTGAYSRFYLEEWLRENSGKKIKYTIVFLDMNNFKAINDRYGHKKGDEVLKDVVTIFKSEIREDDLVVRFGGDEFILLLDCDCKERGSYILDRINEKLKALISLDIEVSFAYGLEELNNTSEFYDVLEKIDMEMYKMKEKARE